MLTDDALFEVYRKYWPHLQTALRQLDAVGKRISYPLLMCMLPEYLQSRTRLFVVGKYTNGWGPDPAEYWGTSKWDDTIEKMSDDDYVDTLILELMNTYRKFHVGENYVYRSSLLEPSAELCVNLNPFGAKCGFLWSNLIKVDQAKKEPEELIEEAVSGSFRVLQSEIEIANPDIVVFFTSHKYDDRLRRTFEGLRLDKIEGYEEEFLARVVYQSLPPRSFRTYHPGYLTLTKRWAEVKAKIVEMTSS